MSETKPNRPNTITLFCILIGIGLILQSLNQLSSSSPNLPILLDLLVLFAGLVGLWRMKRWGICIVVASAIYGADQLSNNARSINTLLLALVLSLLWRHADKMD